MTFRSGPEGDNHVWDVMIEKGCSEGRDCFKTMNQQHSFFFNKDLKQPVVSF